MIGVIGKSSDAHGDPDLEGVPLNQNRIADTTRNEIGYLWCTTHVLQWAQKPIFVT